MAKAALTAALFGSSANRVNVPSSAISCAAATNAACATRASVPPTLIRRTPSAAPSATVMNGLWTSRFTGFGATAATIADTCSAVSVNGAGEAVRAGLGVGLQPADRLLQVGPADDESLRAAREDDAGAALIDRTPRRPNSLHGQVERVERLVGAARRVLDREAGDPGRRGERDALGDSVRIVGVAALEVRAHRDLERTRDLGEVLQHLGTLDSLVGPRNRPGEAGARRRQRLEPELLEDHRATHVPGIRHHEAALGVQPVKDLDLVVL